MSKAIENKLTNLLLEVIRNNTEYTEDRVYTETRSILEGVPLNGLSGDTRLLYQLLTHLDPQSPLVKNVSRTHIVKIAPQFFKSVKKGTKPFEIRRDDRDYQEGDLLVLREWSEEEGYTGKYCIKTITTVFGREEQQRPYCVDGYVILGLKIKNPNYMELISIQVMMNNA